MNNTDRIGHGPASGFTLIELLVVLAVIATLASFSLSAFAKAKARARRVQCLDHLRQIGQALHSFAADHPGGFPWQVSTADGGTREAEEPQEHWDVIAGELNGIGPLECPQGRHDHRGPGTSSAGPIAVGYALCTEADAAQPASTVATDRNLNATIYDAATASVAEWSGWNVGGHGEGRGNVLLADGSCSILSNAGLRETLGVAVGLAVDQEINFHGTGAIVDGER